jgi:hypothetical protein
LLQPQTLWERLRRLQSSYRLDAHSTWTLVDRRSKARAASS